MLISRYMQGWWFAADPFELMAGAEWDTLGNRMGKLCDAQLLPLGWTNTLSPPSGTHETPGGGIMTARWCYHSVGHGYRDEFECHSTTRFLGGGFGKSPCVRGNLCWGDGKERWVHFVVTMDHTTRAMGTDRFFFINEAY